MLLGVTDVARSMAFYESLGWKKSPTGPAGFAKFDLGGYALCLLRLADLAKDALAEPSRDSAFKGIAFVHLAKSVNDVTLILE